MARMAKAAKKPVRRKKKTAAAPGRVRRALRWVLRGAGALVLALLAWVLLYTVVNPPITPYMLAESYRQGGITRQWVDIEDMAPDMARAVVAAEDANYCLHWGFDMAAIRAALDEGANRGASTITQQVVKNTFLWHGRSWARKALEAVLTPVVELVWTKRRILEIYLNIAEFDRGRFGAQAAAQGYFGVNARDLTGAQAARLAAVLPDPKGRNAAKPTNFLRKRAASIQSGAETIKADGRSACFED